MRLSKKGRYGVRAMVCLALHNREAPVSIKTIAREENIPVAFLEQLFYQLKKAGIVRSCRGPRGGFLLSMPAQQIRVLDIIEALGETVVPVECIAPEGKKSSCDRAPRCATHLLWGKLSQRVREVLQGTTLQDMSKSARRLRRVAV